MAFLSMRVDVGTEPVKLADVAPISNANGPSSVQLRCPTTDLHLGGANIVPDGRGTPANSYVLPSGQPQAADPGQYDDLYVCVQTGTASVHVLLMGV